jgi:hypothetical protein
MLLSFVVALDRIPGLYKCCCTVVVVGGGGCHRRTSHYQRVGGESETSWAEARLCNIYATATACRALSIEVRNVDATTGLYRSALLLPLQPTHASPSLPAQTR